MTKIKVNGRMIDPEKKYPVIADSSEPAFAHFLYEALPSGYRKISYDPKGWLVTVYNQSPGVVADLQALADSWKPNFFEIVNVNE